MSVGSGCPGSSSELSEEGGTIRHLLEFYVVLALFLLSFNLVPCHSDVLHRTLHLHTYGISFSLFITLHLTITCV